jgi:hypothetical protein
MDFRPKPILRIPTTPTTRGSPKSCDVSVGHHSGIHFYAFTFVCSGFV